MDTGASGPMRGTEKGCFWAFEVGSRSEALAFSLAHGVNINPLVHSVADHGLPLPSGPGRGRDLAELVGM